MKHPNVTVEQVQETFDYLRRALKAHRDMAFSVLAVFGSDSSKWAEHCCLDRALFRDTYRMADLVAARKEVSR